MAEKNAVTAAAFDFSLEAQDFNERLWQKLQPGKPVPDLQPLEDDDLEWVSAAGVINRSKEKNPFQ